MTREKRKNYKPKTLSRNSTTVSEEDLVIVVDLNAYSSLKANLELMEFLLCCFYAKRGIANQKDFLFHYLSLKSNCYANRGKSN
jgi:hypothetical protein